MVSCGYINVRIRRKDIHGNDREFGGGNRSAVSGRKALGIFSKTACRQYIFTLECANAKLDFPRTWTD